MTAAEWELRAYPHLLRRQAVIWSVLLGGAAVYGWFALPAHVRALFTGLQVGTLVFFLLFILGVLWVLALGYVRAGASGMEFRNGLRTHRLRWDSVESIRYGSADHWAFVDLTDDTDLPLLGIQRSDGRLAEEQVAQLREVAARYGVRPGGAAPLA